MFGRLARSKIVEGCYEDPRPLQTFLLLKCNHVDLIVELIGSSYCSGLKIWSMHAESQKITDLWEHSHEMVDG